MKNKAFTLIEVMLAAAITTLLIALLVSVANAVSSAWSRGESQAEASGNARGALNLLTRELQGAVIDLDLGFRISSVAGEPNQFVLKFLTRADPDPDETNKVTNEVIPGTPAVRKVCYQLGWANQRLLPQVQSLASDATPTPVLVRTESEDLTDVFQVNETADADRWTREWGDLKPGASVSAGVTVGSERLDIAADNVLGWQVIPFGWNNVRIVPDEPGESSRYYDRYLTSDVAPRALEIKLAVLPSRAVVRAAQFAEDWRGIRSDPQLFELQNLSSTSVKNTPFNDILRRDVKFFSTTIYLQSKTP